MQLNPSDLDSLKNTFGSSEADDDRQMLYKILETLPSEGSMSERKTRKDFSSRRDVVTQRPNGRSLDALRHA